MKNVAILGSTGSIGRNTLDVMAQLRSSFRVHSLTARTQLELLANQIRTFRPRRVALPDANAVDSMRRLLQSAGESKAALAELELLSGDAALVELAKDPEVDIVVNALVGAAGLLATLAALQADKILALANKESIVMAGRLVMDAAAQHDGLLIPIDSEHSAILQCLRGEDPKQVSRLILTASGGPFLRKSLAEQEQVTAAEALQHPNWLMGPKITVDSATLMNKGLEVIEAHYLFNLPPEKIHVVIHPQSIVHSLVEFVDGSLKAQLSNPDMRIPIQYALTYPERQPANFTATDLVSIGELSFENPDLDKFPCLRLAYQALAQDQSYTTVVNAANETAVEAFLGKRISFQQIPKIIESAMNAFKPVENLNLKSVLQVDQWTRDFCGKLMEKN
ncbi:MAG: 1-deoxy-D-xylulose-5-phosphate reductoisomerase [bacterium]